MPARSIIHLEKKWAAENLPRKGEALSSNSSTAKKKKPFKNLLCTSVRVHTGGVCACVLILMISGEGKGFLNKKQIETRYGGTYL
jgi:hypothetical protein